MLGRFEAGHALMPEDAFSAGLACERDSGISSRVGLQLQYTPDRDGGTARTGWGFALSGVGHARIVGDFARRQVERRDDPAMPVLLAGPEVRFEQGARFFDEVVLKVGVARFGCVGERGRLERQVPERERLAAHGDDRRVGVGAFSDAVVRSCELRRSYWAF